MADILDNIKTKVRANYEANPKKIPNILKFKTEKQIKDRIIIVTKMLKSMKKSGNRKEFLTTEKRLLTLKLVLIKTYSKEEKIPAVLILFKSMVSLTDICVDTRSKLERDNANKESYFLLETLNQFVKSNETPVSSQ